MNKTTLAALILTSLFLAAATLGYTQLAGAQSGNSFPQLSMPTEQINYTVTELNGTLWAQVDGEYPIHLSQPVAALPMVYPMPPNSTDIHVFLNGQELGWSNYTQASGELHQTSIGDWWMIGSALGNLSDSFTLKIHYEHPIEQVNDSYIFLYDLNIADYLSDANPTSTAHFTIRFGTNITDLHVYTATPESVQSQWQSKDFSATKEGSDMVVSVTMQSQYGMTLPGDLAIVFSRASGQNDSGQGSYLPWWVVPVVVAAVLVSILVYVKRKGFAARFTRKPAPAGCGFCLNAPF